jgi:hypothetical protein
VDAEYQLERQHVESSSQANDIFSPTNVDTTNVNMSANQLFRWGGFFNMQWSNLRRRTTACSRQNPLIQSSLFANHAAALAELQRSTTRQQLLVAKKNRGSRTWT